MHTDDVLVPDRVPRASAIGPKAVLNYSEEDTGLPILRASVFDSVTHYMVESTTRADSGEDGQ